MSETLASETSLGISEVRFNLKRKVSYSNRGCWVREGEGQNVTWCGCWYTILDPRYSHHIKASDMDVDCSVTEASNTDVDCSVTETSNMDVDYSVTEASGMDEGYSVTEASGMDVDYSVSSTNIDVGYSVTEGSGMDVGYSVTETSGMDWATVSLVQRLRT
ncbi:hypothetical protein J6590_065585 [Homalodisca vitripennis]|nr:hypothetical protein J6590_065585 [Homalodisca vitripennis]